MDRIAVVDRIVLHLLEYSKDRKSFFLPPEVAQKGIARSIGASRSNVTLELKRLREEGSVEEELRRVAGTKAKMKCYFLTEKGKDLANEMREALLKKEVTLMDVDGSEVRLTGKEAFERMRRGIGLSASRALEEIAETDFVDLTLLKPPTPSRPFPLPEKFFGREKEIHDLSGLLKQSTPEKSTPLVISLMGITGIGKTSLVAKVASEYERASFFHRTHEWDSPSTIMRALASFLKEQGKERMYRYARKLQPDPRELAIILREDLPRGLLVFDDCHKSEHVQSFLSALMDVGESWPAKIIAVSRRKP
ncbi:MAG: AAA family ATPase, partial [Thermoplasmata archaeon]